MSEINDIRANAPRIGPLGVERQVVSVRRQRVGKREETADKFQRARRPNSDPKASVDRGLYRRQIANKMQAEGDRRAVATSRSASVAAASRGKRGRVILIDDRSSAADDAAFSRISKASSARFRLLSR